MKTNSKNRNYDTKVVDEILELDKKWRNLKTQDDHLRHERNKISQEINKSKKSKNSKKANTLIKKARINIRSKKSLFLHRFLYFCPGIT